MNETMLGTSEKATAVTITVGRFFGPGAIQDAPGQNRATIAYAYKSRPLAESKGFVSGKPFVVLSASRSEMTGMIVAEIELVGD